MAKQTKLSPMMMQYFEIKSQYDDMILFFRLGDFYEMFFEDAKIASQELDLVLTGKDCGQEERAPMCGIPFHSADGYIARLVSKGYKVAICEQVENPAAAKGIVKRDVIRIITPGTVIEGDMLEDGINNYLCAVCADDTKTGLCFADVSTGEFHITVIDGDDVQNKLINQLSTYSPREILINSKALGFNQLEAFAKRIEASVEVLDDEKFDFENAANLVVETLKKDEIASLNAGHSKEGVCALGVVIGYLKETQKKNEIEKPSEIDYYDDEQYMSLDISARRNLELIKSMMTGDKSILFCGL